MREMKDSGIEWIGKIPENWDSLKLKHCVDCLDNERIPIDSAQRVDGPYPYWGAGSITDYVNDYIFDEDLVLLGEDGAPFFDPLRDVAHHINGKCWINNHIHVLRSRDKVITNSFLTYWLNSVDYKTYINGSILNKLTQSNMMRINVFTPSLEEQHHIASFLDSKCYEIDALSADIQKEIEALQEYRKSVITEAVTKGLDPDVEMKDSGVEWIGEIPANWDVHRISNYFSERNVKNNLGLEQNLLSLSYGKIIRKDINSNGGLLPESFNTYNIVEAGDIIIRPTDLQNDKRSLRTGLVCEHGIITSAYIDLAPKYNVISKFYHYQLHAFDIEKVFYNMGNGVRQGLNYNEFAKLLVVEPPVDEQLLIVKFLDTKCSEIDSLISDKQKQLENLAEYRKSLIYEYVTGKKEVPTA